MIELSMNIVNFIIFKIRKMLINSIKMIKIKKQ